MVPREASTSPRPQLNTALAASRAEELSEGNVRTSHERDFSLFDLRVALTTPKDPTQSDITAVLDEMWHALRLTCVALHAILLCGT